MVEVHSQRDTHSPGGGGATPPAHKQIAAPNHLLSAPLQVGTESLQHGFPHPSPAQVEGFACATFDLDAVRSLRHSWGVFRDRRPEHYSVLGSLGADRTMVP